MHKVLSSNMWFLFLKDGIDYAEKNGMFFIETSAKTADNINQLFEVFLLYILTFDKVNIFIPFSEYNNFYMIWYVVSEERFYFICRNVE